MSKDGSASVELPGEESQERRTRREFCSDLCRTASLAAVGGALGTILQGCGGGPAGPSGAPALPVISGSLSNGSIVLGIDASSPLAAVGSAAVVLTSSGPFLVAHTAQDTFTALRGVCTHQACDITGYASGTYVCPCHGSQFTTSGRVVSGPAQVPLRQYATQFADSQLTITL
jgi:cytochrome b6-f complex iron-sulfur subunit